VAIFFGRGGMAILLGVLQKTGVFMWCFGGENVVICVVNVVRCRPLFERLKK
jgi:hypothetical protein